MANTVRVPNLRVVGSVWRTWYRSHGSIRSRSTGIKADDIDGALKFSKAITQFRTPDWDTPSMYGRARAIHAKAADCHYEGLLPVDDSGTVAENTGVPCAWPVPGMDEQQVISLNEALKRSRQIERDNEELKQKLAEKEQSEAALLAALGQKAVSTKPWAEALAEYLVWGETQGKKRPWSHHHLRKVTAQTEWWTEHLNPTMLSDITLPKVEAACRTIPGAPRTRQSYFEVMSGFLFWCSDKNRKYLPENPLDGTNLDKTPQVQRRALTELEITALLTKCKPQRRLLYELALSSGLRKNELKQLVVAATELPHLILVDWEGDGIDGRAILRAVKTNHQTRRVPVLVMTDRAVNENLIRELGIYGVQWILEKPIVSLGLPRLIVRTLRGVSPAGGPKGNNFKRAILVDCGDTASSAVWNSVA